MGPAAGARQDDGLESDRNGAQTRVLKRLLASLRGSAAAVAPAFPAAPRLYATPAPAVLERLRSTCRARVDQTIEAAERILRHEFDLLGSGPFVPVDPDRPPRER